MSQEYLDTDDDALRPLIHRAAARGDVSTAIRLLDADSTLVHIRNEIDNQPLHEACCEDRIQMVALLIDRGADVNARGDFGQTPLHFAVRNGDEESLELVTLLVNAGADVEAQDDRLKNNPLGFALREFNDDLQPTIDYLRGKGSSLQLESAMILGDSNRVAGILNGPEPPTVEEVRPVLQLANSCEQYEIANLLTKWLKTYGA